MSERLLLSANKYFNSFEFIDTDDLIVLLRIIISSMQRDVILRLSRDCILCGRSQCGRWAGKQSVNYRLL